MSSTSAVKVTTLAPHAEGPLDHAFRGLDHAFRGNVSSGSQAASHSSFTDLESASADPLIPGMTTNEPGAMTLGTIPRTPERGALRSTVSICLLLALEHEALFRCSLQLIQLSAET